MHVSEQSYSVAISACLKPHEHLLHTTDDKDTFLQDLHLSSCPQFTKNTSKQPHILFSFQYKNTMHFPVYLLSFSMFFHLFTHFFPSSSLSYSLLPFILINTAGFFNSVSCDVLHWEKISTW